MIDGALVQGFVYRDRLQVAAELDGAGNVVSGPKSSGEHGSVGGTAWRRRWARRGAASRAEGGAEPHDEDAEPHDQGAAPQNDDAERMVRMRSRSVTMRSRMVRMRSAW